MKMEIGKWGDSLAVRLPRELVERCSLKEGDTVDLELLQAEAAHLQEEAKAKRREALEKLRARSFPLPADWKMTREEMNWRPAFDKW